MTGTTPSKTAARIGWGISGLLVLALLADGAVGLFAPQLLAADMAKTGFPEPLGPALAAISLVCAVVYAIPRTATLGAVLITGFLGGAICTHLRVGEVGSVEQIASAAMGAMAWGGLWLRDTRVRALLPLSR